LLEKPILIDSHTHVGISFKSYVQNEYPYGLSFEDLILRMNHLGIQKACVFPFPNSGFYQIDKKPGATLKTTRKFSSCPYELENRNLLHEIYTVFPEHSHRVLPFLMFDPSRQIAGQINVMEKLAGQYPVFGLKTCTHQIKAYIKDLTGKGSPIIEFARKRNIPVTCHSSYYHGDPWANVYDILDVVEKHPEVRFCIAHTARFAKDALERAAALPNCHVDLSAFLIHCQLVQQKNPSVPAEENRFTADYDHPQSVLKRLVDTFPDTLIWGSDMPFNYCFVHMIDINGNYVSKSLKSAYADEYTLIKSLPPADLRQITYTNTLKFLFGNQNQEDMSDE
jgi:predicted TIM-barrel fold metal-dependent hydrolase